MNKRANFTANSEFPEGGDQGGGNEGVSAGPSSTSAPPFMSRLVHANNPTAGAPLATDATAETGFVLEGSSSLFDCEAGGASARLRGAEVIRTNIFRLVSMVKNNHPPHKYSVIHQSGYRLMFLKPHLFTLLPWLKSWVNG